MSGIYQRNGKWVAVWDGVVLGRDFATTDDARNAIRKFRGC